VEYLMGVPQIFSYTLMEEPFIVALNCNTGQCIDPPPPSPSPTGTEQPTPTPTQTPTPTGTNQPTPTNTETPTQTQTPTNTSTPTPTPEPTVYEVQSCLGGSTYGITGNIVPSVGGVYKLYAPSQFGGFDGNQCWVVLGTIGGAPDFVGVTYGTNYITCISCVDVTPTPTATLEITPTPTPTSTLTIPIYYCVQFDCTAGRCVANGITAYAIAQEILTLGQFYNVGASYVWLVVSISSGPIDLDLTGAIGYDVCTDACTF